MFSQWRLYLSIAIAVSVIALTLSAAQNAQERDRLIRAMEAQAEQIDTNEARIRRLLREIETLVDQLEDAGIEPQHKEEEEKPEVQPSVSEGENKPEQTSSNSKPKQSQPSEGPKEPREEPRPDPKPEPSNEPKEPDEGEEEPPEEEEPEEEGNILNDTLESFPDPFEVLPNTDTSIDVTTAVNPNRGKSTMGSGGRSRSCDILSAADLGIEPSYFD